MKTSRSAWGSDEREEYDTLLGEIVTATSSTSDRLDMFERKLNDAIQAQRPWARDIERSCVRNGMAKEIKGYQDRNRAMVAYNGTVLNLPRVQGTVVRSESGEVHHQRELIELWSWDQIVEKRAEAIRGRRTYTSKIAHYDRLLALREMCPDAESPADAVRLLNLSLDDYLGEEKAA